MPRPTLWLEMFITAEYNEATQLLKNGRNLAFLFLCRNITLEKFPPHISPLGVVLSTVGALCCAIGKLGSKAQWVAFIILLLSLLHELLTNSYQMGAYMFTIIRGR